MRGISTPGIVSPKMVRARTALIMDSPFFGSLALRLDVREDPSCKTGWTDGQTLGYNPAWVESLSLDQTKGFFCHEIMHLVNNHQTRREGRKKDKWNTACDYAINPILQESNIVLPPGGLVNHAFTGKAAEEIYNLLPDLPANDGDSGGEGAGSGGKQDGENPNSDKGNWQEQDPGGCGEVRDAKSPDGQTASKADLAQNEAEWKIAMAQAAQQAKAMGSLPAGIARLVEELLEPEVNWKEMLWQFVDKTARNDYTWSELNRRYLPYGLYLPSLKSEELKPIVVAIDTSGTIDKEMLDQFSAEVTAILEAYRTNCTVIYCDADIQNVEEFSTDDLPVVLNPKGGGGTDFRPPFQYVEQNGLSPSCFIYLTDMWCTSFPEEPDYPVLWLKIGKGGYEPPFGEMVNIKE